jgi:hypothetical protein
MNKIKAGYTQDSGTKKLLESSNAQLKPLHLGSFQLTPDRFILFEYSNTDLTLILAGTVLSAPIASGRIGRA